MFFRRKKKEPKENPLQDKVAGSIASVFITVQLSFSKFMSKVFSKMNIKGKMIVFICFCLVSGGFSIYLLVNAIVSKPQKSFRIEKVKIPAQFDRPGDAIIENVIPDEIIDQIRNYKHYMDSMQLPIRKSLQDSMRVLEEMYLSQQK
jgi:hypothetical protein